MSEIKEILNPKENELENLTNIIENLSKNYKNLLNWDFNAIKVQERIDEIKIWVLSILWPWKEEIKKDIEQLYDDILNLWDLINIQKEKILILEWNLKEKSGTNKIKELDNEIDIISQNHADILDWNLSEKEVQERLENIKTWLFESTPKKDLKIHLKTLYEKVINLRKIVNFQKEKILILEIRFEIQEWRVKSRGPFTNYVMIREEKHDI